jgi:cob(I)alamin adenosyltransferase
MVRLTRIYTRIGDGGSTSLADGSTTAKTDPRIAVCGAVDETNACVGLARSHTAADAELDAALARIQNELFDLGADFATPTAAEREGLRIVEAQVARLETEIDAMNARQAPLSSFVLPGGSPAAAALHLARTVCRRAERDAWALNESGAGVNAIALRYLNRLSDLLFVAARRANGDGAGDVLWRPAATR